MIKHIKCNIFDCGVSIILHSVNCKGVMGAGLAKQIREKYPNVYSTYCKHCHDAKEPLLGSWLAVKANDGKWIINLFGQDGFGRDKRYTDYDALKKSMYGAKAALGDVPIAIPYKLGCGLGGGDWNIVYGIIEEVFGDNESDVLICEI